MDKVLLLLFPLVTATLCMNACCSGITAKPGYWLAQKSGSLRYTTGIYIIMGLSGLILVVFAGGVWVKMLGVSILGFTFSLFLSLCGE